MQARLLRLSLVLLIAAGALSASGCIRSRARVTSDPPGAAVYWKDDGPMTERGTTPIDIPFIWYWHYDVALEKEGYERLETSERFRARPWMIFPLDFFWEIMPFPVTDTRELHYVLTPETD